MRVDLSTLPSRFKFVAFVPQWDFLEFVTAEASRYPSFKLIRQAEVTDLLTGVDSRVAGVRFQAPTGVDEVRADLTIGADGRISRVREAAGLPLVETSPPMDVLWFRVSRRDTDGDSLELRLLPGHLFALINRRDYWQIAYVIPKGTYAQVRAAGLEAFRRSLADGAPELAERVDEIQNWEQVKLLTVRSDRLRRWYRPGLLCIGDAAHAMSPIGGVGINVAIQDAVEAANLLWAPLARGDLSVGNLARVQRRRELPVRLTQGFQSLLQENVLRPTLAAATTSRQSDRAEGAGLSAASSATSSAADRVAADGTSTTSAGASSRAVGGAEDGDAGGVPGLVRVALRLPVVRNLPARLIALGLSRPKVRTPLVEPSLQPEAMEEAVAFGAARQSH
jgi:2-polyprenyl-6-methoxyphenol hydroxylase-like FAD-dependent oxidoreductase